MSEISIIKGSNLPVMPTEDRVLDKLRLFGYRTDEMETVQIKGSEIQKELDKTVTDSSGYPEFNPEEDYFKGQVVSNQGKLYKFKNNHTAGPWDPSDVDPWSLGDEISETNQEIADIKDKYAQKDGYYSQMTVGSAENLVGQTVDSEAYLIRPTGGESNEVANGVASVLGMEGNSAVWNQMVQNGNFSDGTTGWTAETGVTFSVSNNIASVTKTSGNTGIYHSMQIIANHKYYIKGRAYCEADTAVNISGSSTFSVPASLTAGIWKDVKGITTRDSNFSLLYIYEINDTPHEIKLTNLQIIDLTLLGIDNLTTVAQVEAWLAQHVGTKPYYAYNAGEILNAKMIGMRTVGRNLLNPETKQATLIPYTWEDNSNVFVVKNVPSGSTATFTPDNTGEAVSVDVSGGSLDITSYGSGVLELSAATADTYVCFKWDGTKDNDVVPFVEHNYTFDTRKVYGRVNGQGEYVQCFPNGMGSAGTAKVSLAASEAVDNIGSVDLGTIDWLYNGNYFVSPANSIQPIPNGSNGNGICTKYAVKELASLNTSNDKTIGLGDTQTYIRDTSYTDAATFKAAMNGVMLNYELATPITYTDLIYRDGGVDTPLSEVLINMEVDNWGIEQQLMTPYENGNPTSIPATLSTIYSMDAVEAIDTLQKTTYTEAEVHDNLAALLSCINTNSATVLGGTFAVSDTATDKVFEFTFTANPEPEP